MNEHPLYDNVQPFVKLGEHLLDSDFVKSRFEQAFTLQNQRNPWFTPYFCQKALETTAQALNEEGLTHFVNGYDGDALVWNQHKKVAVIPAGDVPLSAFRDMFYVLLSGNDFVCKQAPQDTMLLPILAQILIEIEPTLKERIGFTNKLCGFDAVIAEGKPDSLAAFERYFQKFPHIIRYRQRTAASLTGEESTDELRALSEDIYLYFGLAPRSVNKLYVPKDYDFVPLLHTLNEASQPIADHNQYLNNLDYQKAIRLMSSKYYMDAGTFLLVEDDGSEPAPAVIQYTYCNGQPSVSDNEITVSAQSGIPFGKANKPDLADYPNHIDVMQFLGRL